MHDIIQNVDIECRVYTIYDNRQPTDNQKSTTKCKASENEVEYGNYFGLHASCIFYHFHIEMVSGDADADADSLFNEFIKFIISLFAQCATVLTMLYLK